MSAAPPQDRGLRVPGLDEAGFVREHDGLNAVSHGDRKSTRLNSSHLVISYAVFCLKKKHNLLEKSQQSCLQAFPLDGSYFAPYLYRACPLDTFYLCVSLPCYRARTLFRAYWRSLERTQQAP